MPQFLKDGEIITPKRKGTFYTDVIAVIPAYNAEKTIGNVVRKTLRKVGRCIVVDDGSSDGTGNAAIDAGAELIVHVSNRGKGVAICTAINSLRKIPYKYIVFLDADGQHQPGEIARIVQAAQRRRAHLVCGNRMSKPEGMPFIRRTTNRVMSKVVSKLCKVNLTDTQCGYRLLSKKAVESLQLTKSNFEVDSEMLYQVAHKRLKVTEVTVSSIYSSDDYSSHIRPVKDTCCFLRTAFGLFFSNLKLNTAGNTKIIRKEKEKPKTEKPRAKVVRPKAERPRAERPRAERPRAERPKAERPRAERPKVERPKVERPKVERPKVERPKVERPKVERPKVERPKVERPKVERPKVERPKVERPKVERPKVERPKVERPKVEKPKVERPKVERPKVERPKVEKPKVEKPKVEKPKAKVERPRPKIEVERPKAENQKSSPGTERPTQ